MFTPIVFFSSSNAILILSICLSKNLSNVTTAKDFVSVEQVSKVTGISYTSCDTSFPHPEDPIQ
jgi:hypothetical protein